MKRKETVGVLEIVKLALAKDNMVPVFQCFGFDDGNVFAYDGQTAIVGPTDCKQSFGVNGNILLGILSNSSAEDWDVSLEGQNAFIKMGKTKTELPFVPIKDFIFTPPSSGNGSVPLTVSTLEGFKLCLETVSKDETQRALHGITYADNCLFSCNGDAVTRVKIKHPVKKPFLLPTEFCEAIVKVWDGIGETKASLSWDQEWYSAIFTDWSVFSRIPDLKSPLDYEEEIRKTVRESTSMFRVPTGLSEALSRARVLSDPESQKTAIQIESGRIELRTSTHMGDIDDTLPLKDHPKVTCSINASHIQQAIKICDEIAFHENCVILQKGADIFMLVSNM